MGEFDEFGTYPVSVVRHGGGYRAYYAGWTRCESVPFNVAIGMATSADGITFERWGRGPVLPYTLDEPYVLSGPKIRRFDETWYLFYIAGRKWKPVDGRAEPVYKIRLPTSADGITWTSTAETSSKAASSPTKRRQARMCYYANGAYHMFFSYRYSSHYRGKRTATASATPAVPTSSTGNETTPAPASTSPKTAGIRRW